MIFYTIFQVKLADVLGKYILPVSFLETWPPRCLAIQFATTQFINWRKPKPGQPATPHSPCKSGGFNPLATRDFVTMAYYSLEDVAILLSFLHCSEQYDTCAIFLCRIVL